MQTINHFAKFLARRRWWFKFNRATLTIGAKNSLNEQMPTKRVRLNWVVVYGGLPVELLSANAIAAPVGVR